MTVELTMLAYSVALLFVCVIVHAGTAARNQGPIVMANNRDNLKPPSVFEARAKRLVDNHREGLIMFAPLVLIAAIQGISTEHTVLGAQMFFWSRLAHAIWYTLGLPFARPIFWLIGIAGTVMIFLALFGMA